MLANRILRTGAALSLAAVRQAAPAVFATEPHHTRGPRYQYIPTIEPLEKLLDTGWGVFQATQNRSRLADREGFCRHALKLRPLDFDQNKYGGAADGTLELGLMNAHDGTAAYTLTTDYYRMFCSNSMTSGKSIGYHKIIHSKGRSTGEIIDVVARIVEEDFPRLQRQIELFKATDLTPEQVQAIAQKAMALRYGDTAMLPYDPSKLTVVRREVDAGMNAWNVLNRIQENVMQGGWEERALWSNRRTSVRPIVAVDATHRINTGLWTAVEEMVQA